MAESGLECKIKHDCRVYALNPSAVCLPLLAIDCVGSKARHRQADRGLITDRRNSRANTEMRRVRHIHFKDHTAGKMSHLFLNTGALQQVCLFMFPSAFFLLDSVLENYLI